MSGNKRAFFAAYKIQCSLNESLIRKLGYFFECVLIGTKIDKRSRMGLPVYLDPLHLVS